MSRTALFFLTALVLELPSTEAGAGPGSEVPSPSTSLAASGVANTSSDTPENELETVRRQLAAQRAINQQLMQRVDALEKQLAAGAKTDGPLVVGLDANQPPPVLEPEVAGNTTAIEQALVTKGLVLLPLHSYRVTPSASWAHAGTGPTRQDSYALAADLEAGLPWGMAAGVGVPYIWRDYASGTNQGIGDYSAYLAKRLNNATDTLPSFVARFGYTSDTGKDPFTQPSVGGGFPVYSASLSAVKRADPMVFHGAIFYAHSPEKTVSITDKRTAALLYQGTISPSDVYGVDFGASLAVTPTISTDYGFSFAWARSTRYNPPPAGLGSGGWGSTAGYFNLGVGILLGKNWFLSLSAAAGVTKDAADFIFSMALPYRF